MVDFINSSVEMLAYKADLPDKRPLNFSKIVSQRGTRFTPRRGSAAINSADRIVKFERDWEERDSGRPLCLKRGFYSGSETNPAARMVVDRRSLGRPDNHNLTGRFNEPYARRPLSLLSFLPSDGHLIIRDTPERWAIYPHRQRRYVRTVILSPRSPPPSSTRPSLQLSPVGSVLDLHPRQGFAMSVRPPRHRNNDTLVPRACPYIKPPGRPRDNKDI